MDECPRCNEQIDEFSATLTSKGSYSINKTSEARGLQLRTVSGQQVHTKCRKVHCSQSSIDAFNQKKTKDCSHDTSHVLRSAESAFEYKTHCLFCGTKELYHGKKADCTIVPVRTYDLESKVLEAYRNRQDDWSLQVQARVDFVPDLPAVDAVYH